MKVHVTTNQHRHGKYHTNPDCPCLKTVENSREVELSALGATWDECQRCDNVEGKINGSPNWDAYNLLKKHADD